MNTIIIVLCTVLAVAQAHYANEDRTDNYIKLRRLQNNQALEKQDARLKNFAEHNSGRVDNINIQLDMVTGSIIQIEERLNPLEVLNDFCKQCVQRHRPLIAAVQPTQKAITVCVTEVSSELEQLLSGPHEIRNELWHYYENDFETAIKSCGDKYSQTSANYSTCIVDVVYQANDFTAGNQKEFEYRLDTAECDAKANIKRAIDCSYSVTYDTLSGIATADLLIDNCLKGKDVCEPCAEYTCSESLKLKVDYNNATIVNPFHGLEDNHGCLMLDLQ